MATVRFTSRSVVSLVSPLAILIAFVVAFCAGGFLLAQRQAQVPQQPVQPLRSLSMVSADFDEDGVADLAIGYETGKGGAIGVMRGNIEAIAPQTRAGWLAVSRHEFAAPFLQPSRMIRLAARPDILIAADVNGDGHHDLVYSTKGSGLVQVLAGDGRGAFASKPISIAVPGAVTALASYRPGAPCAGEAGLVGYKSRQGAGLAILTQGPAGMKISAAYALPGAATSFSVANLDDDFIPDTAIVAGGQLLVLHGANAVNGHGQLETLPVYNAEAVTTGAFLFDRHAAMQLAVVTTDGDVLVLAHQGFDPRPFTPQEIATQRHLRPGSPTLAQLAGDNARDPWTVIETNSQAAPHSTGSSAPLLLRSRISGSSGDDLVVLNASEQQRITISHSSGAAKSAAVAPRRIAAGSLSSSDKLVAAVSARLNTDARPGIAVLSENSIRPEFTVPSTGNTFYVNTTADNTGSTTDADDGTRCSTGSGEICTLRDAIVFANTDAAGNIAAGTTDTIMLPAGTYTLSWQAGVFDSNANAVTHLEILGPVSIVGAGSASTMVNANSNDTAFTINPGAYGYYSTIGGSSSSYAFDTAISNLTIENGKNPNNPANSTTGLYNNVGGGINWDAYGTGNLTLTNVNIQNSTVVYGDGGGLWVENSANGGTGNATISGSTISGNTTADLGGGMEVAYPPAQVVVTNTTISGNTANPSVNGGISTGFGGGGGIQVDARPASSGTAQSTFTNVTIGSNTALEQGGGILDYSGILLTGSVVQGNSVTSSSAGNPGLGGGVFISEIAPESAPTITGTNILSNTAALGGGGIYVNNDGGNELTLSLSRIYGNTASSGTGGLAVASPTTATATDNWWGCNAGPAGSPCDKADSGATTSPWAELTIGANTATIGEGGSINLTVALNTDSSANPIAGAFPAVSGDSIAYSVTGVTDSPALTSGTFASNGTDSPTLTPTSTGNGSVSATFDGQLVSLNFSVSAGSATHVVVAAPSTAVAGTPISVSVTAYDAYGNVATGYTGTVQFSSTDVAAALPANSTLTNGAGTFSATLNTAGSQTITATDTVNSTISGTSGSIVVTSSQVQLTIAATPVAGGTVTPASGGLYNLGTVVPITATPNTGFTFLGWMSSPNAVASPTSASTTITMNAAETVMGQFSANLVVSTAADDNPGVAANCTPQAMPGSNTVDAACSLRDALAFASNAGAANITFASAAGQAFATPQTITLGSGGTLSVPANTMISGPSTGTGYMLANLVTVSGANAYTVFTVNSGVTGAQIDNLAIANGNDAIGGSAGGVGNSGSLTISNCTISGNREAQGGGGISNVGTLTVNNSTISGNAANTNGSNPGWGGGGIYNEGNLTVNNSTISGNTSISNGGGIYSGAGIVTVNNSTMSGNTASGGAGGGIYSTAKLTLANSISAGNTGQSNGDVSGSYTDNGGNQVGTAVNLSPLGSYGGPTQTMLPLPSSPAICGGTLANAAAAGLTTDQRGFVFDPHCPAGWVDSGAVQTNFAMGFSGVPADLILGQTFSPTVTLYESGVMASAENGNPVTLSDTSATLGGTTTQSFAAGVASFTGISFTTLGYITELQATTALNATLNLTATAGRTITSSPVPAVLISPSGSVLPGPAATFSWNAVSGATGYSLWIGTTGVGSHNFYHSGETTSTSIKLGGLPTNGKPMYVRLYTNYNGVAQANDYVFAASMPAAFIYPTPGSTLSGSSVTFTWSDATGSALTGYSLWLGKTPGGHDLFVSGTIIDTAINVNKLPIDGSTIYATLYSNYSGAVVSAKATYTAARQSLAMLQTPTPGSVLTGSRVTFTWSAATTPGATGYSLWLGSTPGGHDLYVSGSTTGTSATANGLPINGSTIYATLYTNFGGSALSTKATYTAARQSLAMLQTPSPGSILTGAKVTFTWSASTIPGVSGYSLWLGSTPGGHDLYNSHLTTGLSATATGLPTNSSPIYATLYTNVSGVVKSTTAVYTAF